jgi:putative ABC transport system substrate-binding protein
MILKILIWLLTPVFLTNVPLAQAQQAKNIPRIGFVSGRVSPTPANPDPSAEAFRKGLRDLGYSEGKNILIEFRYVEGNLDRVQGIVAELVQLKVDALVSPSTPVITASKQATSIIPIVMVITTDPVTTGLVASLARPGGNITGLYRLTRDLSGKRLELLKEAVPSALRIGILWDARPEPTVSGSAIALKEYESAAAALKIQLQSLEVRGPNPDLEGAFRAAAKGRANAVISVRTVVLVPHEKRIAELAMKNQLPSMFEEKETVEVGGLMSYSANQLESFRRAAYYVDRILKGAKPADLPVEQPTKFELVINLKTAKQIGLTIPQSMLYRADKVIK